MIVCLVSRDEAHQPRVDAMLRRLPAPQLRVEARDAAPLLDRRLA